MVIRWLIDMTRQIKRPSIRPSSVSAGGWTERERYECRIRTTRIVIFQIDNNIIIISRGELMACQVDDMGVAKWFAEGRLAISGFGDLFNLQTIKMAISTTVVGESSPAVSG